MKSFVLNIAFYQDKKFGSYHFCANIVNPDQKHGEECYSQNLSGIHYDDSSDFDILLKRAISIAKNDAKAFGQDISLINVYKCSKADFKYRENLIHHMHKNLKDKIIMTIDESKIIQ